MTLTSIIMIERSHYVTSGNEKNNCSMVDSLLTLIAMLAKASSKCINWIKLLKNNGSCVVMHFKLMMNVGQVLHSTC